MELWFSSDPHFYHENIIRFAGRPFKDAAEMNEAIIERHNALVKPEDHWTCLGDVTMRRDNQGNGLTIVGRMNGHKRLIMGNHDHYAMKHYLQYFEKVYAMNMYDNIRFTHIAVHPESMGNAVGNVHGHIHEKEAPAPVILQTKEGKTYIKPYVNISMEKTNYAPLTLGQVKSLVQKEIDRLSALKYEGSYVMNKNGYNISSQHCEICGLPENRLELYRCLEHTETDGTTIKIQASGEIIYPNAT